MFDFQNLDVYRKAKELNKEILQFLKENKQIDFYIRDQLKRASISTVINIAEGSGNFPLAIRSKKPYTACISRVLSPNAPKIK